MRAPGGGQRAHPPHPPNAREATAAIVGATTPAPLPLPPSPSPCPPLRPRHHRYLHAHPNLHHRPRDLARRPYLHRGTRCFHGSLGVGAGREHSDGGGGGAAGDGTAALVLAAQGHIGAALNDGHRGAPSGTDSGARAQARKQQGPGQTASTRKGERYVLASLTCACLVRNTLQVRPCTPPEPLASSRRSASDCRAD